MSKTPDKKRVYRELWKRGHLSFILRPAQKQVYDFLQGNTNRKAVACLHRRCGKSFLAVLMALEYALKHEDATIHYIGMSAEAVSNLSLPIYNKILKTFDPDNPPAFNHHRNTISFANGSRVLMYGADHDVADRKRGLDAHLAIVDESGFFKNLNYIIKDVVTPGLLSANGKLLYISTPSKSPAHPYARIAEQAEQEGWYFKYTLRDNKDITPEFYAECAKECGGEETTTFRREYMCEFLTDETAAVIPELIKGNAARPYTKQLNESTDVWGAIHYSPSETSFLLIADYNPSTQSLHIVDECVMSMPSLDQAKKAFGSFCKIYELKERPIVLSEMTDSMIRTIHAEDVFSVCPTKSEDLQADVARLRSSIYCNRLSIDPRCKTLLSHLSGAIWNESRTKFESSGDNSSFGAVTALLHLVRFFPLLGDASEDEIGISRLLGI